MVLHKWYITDGHNSWIYRNITYIPHAFQRGHLGGTVDWPSISVRAFKVP